VWAAARRSWEFGRGIVGWLPVTPLALIAAPLLWWIYEACGRARHDAVVLALAGCGMVLIGAAVLLVLVSALWLRLSTQRTPDELLEMEAGKAFRTGFRLGRAHWNPLLKIDLGWDTPQGVSVRGVVSGGRLEEEATASVRGMTEGVVRRITVGDVLGLARITFRRRCAQPVRVLPACGEVRVLDLLRQTTSGDQLAHPEGQPGGDLIEQRRYVPGDPLKLVLWKVFARTGRMLVRQPERAVSTSEQTLAYLVAAEVDEPAAGVARALLNNGSLGSDFLFGADGEDQMVRTAPEALEQVMRSVRARREAGRGLGAFLARGESLGVRACILFVPGRPGPWLNNVARALDRSSGPFRAIVGIDGTRPAGKVGRLHRWLVQQGPEILADASEVRAIVRRLQQSGAEVYVVNRATGKAVSAAEL
jgi:hypothetical protein